jgi:DNA-binding winged helix-turn-helix (wHTH) protein
MPLEASATPIAIAPDESAEPVVAGMGEAAFVIAVTRSLSTRLQLVRHLPADAVLLLAPDRDSAERALHAGTSSTVDDGIKHAPITCGGLVVDPERQRVTWYGATLRLTRLERRLLTCLIEPPLRVWPYELLYRTVWRQAWLGDASTVHAIVKRLRRRLRDAGVTVELESIRGVGFSLVFQPTEIANAALAKVDTPVRPALLPAPRQVSSSSELATRAAATPSWKRVTTP